MRRSYVRQRIHFGLGGSISSMLSQSGPPKLLRMARTALYARSVRVWNCELYATCRLQVWRLAKYLAPSGLQTTEQVRLVRGHTKYHCPPPKCLGWKVRSNSCSTSPILMRRNPQSGSFILAVSWPEATISPVYVFVHRIPFGPLIAPRSTSPKRASLFRSSRNPSCKQARCLGFAILFPFVGGSNYHD